MEKQKGFLEESLAESQGKEVCRALFDGSPDAIFLADPRTGVILDANPAAERLIGRPVKEIIGLHQTALHPPRREAASRRIFREHSRADGETVSGALEDHYALRADGTEVPIEITAKIIRIRGRRVLQGFFRDVSARRAAESALRESEVRYRTLVNHAPVGIVVHRNGKMRFVNRKLAELAGLPSPTMLAGKQIMDFVHPGSRALAAQRLAEIAASGKPLPPAELKIVAPGGKVYDMEMNSIPITYGGENCVMSIIQDITERKRAEGGLKESEERYRTLVDHAQVGIVVQKKGVVRFANRQMAEIVRVPDPALLVGRSALEFIHPDSTKAAKAHVTVGMVRHHPATEEKLIASDGTVVDAEILTVPISYRGENCTLGIVVDITDHKRTEQALQAAHRKLLDTNLELERRVTRRTSQLEEVNKELEAFSYSAAHDLKAPLRRINIFSDLLEKEAGPTLEGANHDYLVNIHKSVTQMTELVNGLLSLSTTARRPLSLEPVPLCGLLAEAQADIKAENPHQPIEWTLQELPTVNCDRAMIRQVLVNLLDNAVKYSRCAKPSRVEVFYLRKDHEHVIGVRDNGVGFRPEGADKLFGVFQRLHRSDDFEGTGIGLSIVKRIITRHGGRVWAEGAPGKGAVFYFALPEK
ncbi:MAG: PAS domain-containing sensor histidine kinase [Elusimicrobiales bacterium]